MEDQKSSAEEELHLPRDHSREALHALGGYDYQMWASIESWLMLNDGEVLFLEGTEDIDRVGGADVTTFQVKRLAATISLNTRNARTAIKNFWAAKLRASGRVVRFVYLTTSTVALEENAAFGGLSMSLMNQSNLAAEMPNACKVARMSV